MARKRDPESREKILEVATRLFDARGVHAVGMQQIVDEIGCGKAFLYSEFATKEELVIAYLNRYREGVMVTMAQAEARFPDDPARQIVAMVGIVAECSLQPGFRGCSVRNAHAEFPDEDHPARQIAIEYYDEVHGHLMDLAERAGAPDPRTLADRIMLIVDGLHSNAAARGHDGAAPAATAFAEDVVRAALRPLSHTQ
ncbi:TetR/AcrR family transcriptional regulator [Actinocrispum sp. NPDC049592]|uniref:TetR/AcrR family transcriptional regulator n=1 Tax=Actinocrispum sp. NPDC049592 TaxID=3154835 RepID=UPI003430666C